MLILVAASQALRWWCITTLGPQWNTEVVVVPGLPRVESGPYRLRWLRHPNYVAVVVEGAALPLVHSAWITAAVFTACNAVLMAVRIRCENAALAALAPPAEGTGDRTADPAAGTAPGDRTADPAAGTAPGDRTADPAPGRGRRLRRRSGSGVIDVLVAGGGPAGLATAIHAAAAGMEAVVVEPRPGPVDKACGEGLMPTGAAVLRSMGVEPDGWPLRGIRYLDGGTRRRPPSPAAAGWACAVPRCTPRCRGARPSWACGSSPGRSPRYGRAPTASGRPGSGPAGWWPPTVCTRRCGPCSDWTCPAAGSAGTACGNTTRSPPGRTSSRSTGPRTGRRT
nr:hypothetical protein GCM10020093_027850 [Planobispora longispora]